MKNDNLWTIEVSSGTDNSAMHFDSGAGSSSLSNKYFQEHKYMIQQVGKQDTLRMAGFGGVMRKDVYKLSGFPVSVGPIPIYIPEICVLTDSDIPETLSNEDDRFGMNMFYSFGSMLINLRDMHVKTTPKKQSEG